MKRCVANALNATLLLWAGGVRCRAGPELVQPYLDSGLLTILPFEMGLRMDMYGIITRKRHQLLPSAETMLAALRETANRAPAKVWPAATSL